MIDGTESINPTTDSNYINKSDDQPTVGLWGGITLKQHMVIEFTKALISSCDWNHTTFDKFHVRSTVEKAQDLANEVIKQLNEEE